MNQKGNNIIYLLVGFLVVGLVVSAYYLGFNKGINYSSTTSSINQVQIIPGQVRVVFKAEADPQITKAEFSQLSLTLPDNILRSDHTFLATPKRGQAKTYAQKLVADKQVVNIDYSYTDQNLKALGEKTEIDSDYLWITLVKPLSKSEELEWLKNYSDLKDPFTQQNLENFQVVVVNLKTGQESSGGYQNPWLGSQTVDLLVPIGQEEEYVNKIKNLPSVKTASTIIQINKLYPPKS